ncbi:MAG: type I phosphomannose isomerase catalytic subunit [Draconibacterium sp.]
MSGLYPIKFKPIYLEKLWGGQRIKTLLNKDFGQLKNCGESWEISGVEGSISVVSNGFLEGNDLNELIEIYMGELVGEKVYEQFGNEFPLLIKFLDAQDDLSVQVHPNDELSKERHNAFGKTEMWYVVDADTDALINAGFNQPVDKSKYIESVENGSLIDILKYDEAHPGDVFFIPAGRIHAIGKGCMVAEIQQTSDVTYRIFDYNRLDNNGNLRELHTELAIDAIDYSYLPDYKTKYNAELNKSVELAKCKYFTTNLLEFNKYLEKDYHQIDSFVIFMTLDGSFDIETEEGTERVEKGETVLIPASIESLQLKPVSEKVKLLEVYIL